MISVYLLLDYLPSILSLLYFYILKKELNMKLNYYLLICFGVLLCSFDCKKNPSNKEYNRGINIIPMPQNVQLGNGVFTIDNDTKIIISDDSLCQIADFYSKKMQASTGFDINVASKRSKNSIRLSIDKRIGKDCGEEQAAEAYSLSVNKNGVDLKAPTLKGLFYGMATFYVAVDNDGKHG